MTTAIPNLAARLTSWLRTQIPDADADDITIEGLDRVDFGHSAEMLTFTIVTRERTDVVLRLRPHPPALLEPYDLPRQLILSALRDTAVRAPKVLWLEESGDVLGRPFLVMQRVPGDVYEMHAPEGPDVTDTGIRRMCEGMAEQLAAVHTVDLTATGLDWLGDGRDHLDREIAHWADEMHRVQTRPAACARATARRTAREQARTPPNDHRSSTVTPSRGNFAFVGSMISPPSTASS